MGFLGVYGHVNVDHILILKSLPKPETTVPVERELVRLGGTAGNIARAAAILGVPTSLASCVGDDFPSEYRQDLAAAGIDLTDFRHVAGPTPKVWALSVPGSNQSYVIDQGVMADSVSRPRLDFAMLNSEWVHFTTGNPTDWWPILQEARQAKKEVAFDPAQELSYRYDSRTFERFLNHSTVFFCNEPELQRALDLFGYGDPTQLFDHTRRLVITRSHQGSRLMTDKETLDVPVCPVRGVDRVEATGAGDGFRGGLYAALWRKKPWSESLRCAAVTSSLFLEAGGNRFPTWDEVIARLDAWAP